MNDGEISQGARVRVDGLQARPELNGSLGIVGGLNEGTGRWNVMVDDMREALALKPSVLTLAEDYAGIVVGTLVRISGLEGAGPEKEKREEFNGKVGKVQSFFGDACIVYVEQLRESVTVKKVNIVVAEETHAKKADEAGDPEDDGTPIRVECNGVALKLTLSAKQMAKSFEKAVLVPFFKAYSKKKGFEYPPLVRDVAQILIDSEGQREMQELKDVNFPAEQCLKGLQGSIEVVINLKDPTKAPKPPPPKEKSAALLPKDARVLIHNLASQAGQVRIASSK